MKDNGRYRVYGEGLPLSAGLAGMLQVNLALFQGLS